MIFFGGRMQKSKGFTLVELIVTIAVMVIIAMMAAPSFSNLLAKQKLNSTTADLMDTLMLARNQAILLRTATTVNLNAEGTNTALNFFWSPKEKNTLTTNPAGLVAIGFRGDGSLNNAATSFVVCNSQTKTTKTFSLTVMGTVYMTPNNDGTC